MTKRLPKGVSPLITPYEDYFGIILPEEDGHPCGTLNFPYKGDIITKAKAKELAIVITPLIMVFRSLLIFSIKSRNLSPLGHGLGDLTRVVYKGVPSMKQLFLAMIGAIGHKIEESTSEEYSSGLNDAGAIMINIFNQIYDDVQKEPPIIQ